MVRIWCLVWLWSAAYSSALYAQHIVGLNGGMADYYSHQVSYKNSLLLYPDSYKYVDYWRPVFGASYGFPVDEHLELGGRVQWSKLYYPRVEHDPFWQVASPTQLLRKAAVVTLVDALATYYILSPKRYICVPKLYIGSAMSVRTSRSGVDLMMGAGLRIGLHKSAFVSVQSDVRIAQTMYNMNSILHQVGLHYIVVNNKREERILAREFERKRKMLYAMSEPTDRDNDGIADAEDECPDRPGKWSMKGCPDSDNDGIPDHLDLCPLEAGSAQYKGCPRADTDEDGFADEEDECPTEYSLVNAGCPILEADARALLDQYAAQVMFVKDSDSMLASSVAVLPKLAKLMLSLRSYFFTWEIHCLYHERPAMSVELAQQRAVVLRSALQQLGVGASQYSVLSRGDLDATSVLVPDEGKLLIRMVKLK